MNEVACIDRAGRILGGSILAGRILALWLALVCASAATASEKDAATRPNVLFVLVDTLRADHLGAYGYSKPTSPTIDALAEEGVLFDVTLSSAPWTVPATTSIFTSLDPSVHGVIQHGNAAGNLGVLDDDVTTLAEMLTANGYQASAVVANPWLSPKQKLDQGYETYTMVPSDGQTAVTSAAIEWLGSRPQSGAKPFFLYVHYMNVHGPYDDVPSPFDKMFSFAPYPKRELTLREQATVPSYWKIPRQPYLRGYLIRYDREVRFVDAEIGRLLAKLRTLGVRDDTLVVVTSDHGLEFLEHGGWDMGLTLYDENLRVPLILSLPSKLPRGRRIESLVRSIDIMPTILGVLDISLEHEVQGRDLRPVITRSGALELDALSEAVYNDTANEIKSLRTEQWKLIDKSRATSQKKRLRDAVELYDLETDPGEQVDLIGAGAPQERYETAAQRLRLELERRAGEAERMASERGRPNEGRAVDAETLEKLRALGYVD